MLERRACRANAHYALGVALALGAVSSVGHAQEASSHTKEQPSDPKPNLEKPDAEADAPLPPGTTKRPPPGYAEPPDQPAEAAWWVPRVLLFPLYAVTEYGLTRPAGALYLWAERHHLRERFYDFFTFDDDRKIGLYPTGTIDLGFRPTVGAYFVWNDAIGDSDAKIRVTTGGLDLWTVNSELYSPLGRRSFLRLNVDYARRPDSVFYGLGRKIEEDGAHYLAENFGSRVSFTQPYQQLFVTATSGVVTSRFDPGPEGVANESLAEAIASGRIEAPPALQDGFLAVFTGVSARFDTRPVRRPPHRTLEDIEHVKRSGFSVGAHGTQYSGLRATRATPQDRATTPHWLRYGGSLAYSLDVTGTQRTIQLEALYAAVEPLPDNHPVPFTQQISLGGSYPLRAFTGGRLIDQSALVATLSYNWPLLPNLDGSLTYSVGNVFARHLRDFDAGHFRSSYGIGMETVESLDYPFEILLAFGTRPFDEGGGLDTVRFVAGTSAGF